MKTMTLILMIFFINSLFAGKIDIEGDWLIYKMETKKDVREPYQSASFKADGTFLIMDIPVGKWEMKDELINIETRVFENHDEDFSIQKDGKEKLILKSKTLTLYLLKIIPEVVAKDNKASGLEGLWQFQGDYPEMKRIINFSAPGLVKVTETEPGSTSNYSGSWLYFPKEKSVILMLMGTEIKGKYKVKISGNELVLTKGKETIKGKKIKPQNNIEHLSFNEDDFYDANGEYKYDEDAQKLPWTDAYSIIDNLSRIRKLVYDYSILKSGAVVADKKTLTTYVHTEDGSKVCVDYIFKGYDNAHLPEDTKLPTNCFDNSSFNSLFPLKEHDFRVVGTGQITVPAGTFECTVLEGIGDFGILQKMWMINDKPGVYAKIIMEDPDPNMGFYKVFELNTIE